MHSPQLSAAYERDTVGAWVPHGRFVVPPTGDGPLSGLVFAAKDLYDVAGHPTGAGNPDWLASHPPATATSPVIAQLLGAGATLAGKTLTDELAYSIQGDNHHYGTPLNSAAPDRVPGGSSSGSAAAVAARLVDFALGTDTGGSTRVPASYCGLRGLRTTHGLVSCEHMVPLSPRFDTATWLAHDAATFARVGAVLLPDAGPAAFGRAVVLADALEQAEPPLHAPLARVVAALRARSGTTVGEARAAAGSLEAWRETYITASAWDAWQVHGAWITATAPSFGPAIAGRWRMAAKVSDAAALQAFELQGRIRDRMRGLLGADGVAVLPSASSLAIPRNASPEVVDAIRADTFRITCIAGLAGLPQVSIPYLDAAGAPVGVSLLGPAGSDLALIRLAIEIGRATGALGCDAGAGPAA